MKNKLPIPDPQSTDRSQSLLDKIINTILTHGPISLSEYINIALYDTDYGYYQNDNPFNKEGDFITAAHCGPWFAKMLANQIQQIFNKSPLNSICEYAAGDGSMALQLLLALDQTCCLPKKYIIIEQSQHLIQQQKKLFANHSKLAEIICWKKTLASDFKGVIFANELLDAMPFNQYRKYNQTLEQCFIDTDGESLQKTWKTTTSQLPNYMSEYEPLIPDNHIFEISPNSFHWLKDIYQHSHQAVCLLIDYGFVARQYFSRGETGYARAFYKHHVHDDLLLWPGLQDLTTHVNFTQIALEAVDNHWEILGFTNQANFLISCGIEHIALPEYDTSEGVKARAEIKTLLMPHEMGETFKVLALGKNIDLDLLGFEHDISYQL